MAYGLSVARMLCSFPPRRKQPILLIRRSVWRVETFTVLLRHPRRNQIITDVVVEQKGPIVARKESGIRFASHAAALLNKMLVGIHKWRLLYQVPNLMA